MKNEQPSEESLFHQALQFPTPDARAAFLREACADNDPLRQRVEALLQAAQPTNDFLEQPAAKAMQKTADRRQNEELPSPGGGQTIVLSHAAFPVAEKPGDRIGRYKLLERIGEGGCGVVYVAEQQEPVRRRVALKVIKLGMDTRSVVALAMPKSITLGTGTPSCSVTRMFEGLMSRWMMPF